MPADTRVSDAVVMQLNTEKLMPIVNHESPTYNMVRGAAQKKKVNSKGQEMNVIIDVRVQARGGDPDSVNAPGASFDYGRMKAYPSYFEVGYEIGHDKYLDYEKADLKVLASMAMELEAVSKGFAHLREAFTTGDGSGCLGWIDTQANGSSTGVFKFVTQGDGTHGKTFGAHFIKPGVEYDLVNPAAASNPVLSRVTFSSVDKINNTAAVGSATVAITTGMLAQANILVMPDTYKNVPKGMLYQFEVGKIGWWQNINVTGKEVFQTPGVNAAGRKISNALVRLALDRSSLRREDSPQFKMLAPVAQFALYEAQAEGLMRGQMGSTRVYDTSVDEARYKGNTFEKAKYMDADRLIGAPLNKVQMLERVEVGPVKGPDGLLFHKKYDSATGRTKGEYLMSYASYDGFATEHTHEGLQIFNLSHTGAATLANMFDTGLSGI